MTSGAPPDRMQLSVFSLIYTHLSRKCAVFNTTFARCQKPIRRLTNPLIFYYDITVTGQV